MPRRFSLSATVSTDSPLLILPALEGLVGKDSVRRVGGNEFAVETTMNGNDPKDLNRALLSGLRRVEKRTRLRSEWKDGGKTYRFFDYVLKRVSG